MIELARFLLEGGPSRVAPFRHAVRAGELLFVTGQMPTDPGDHRRVVPGGIVPETRQVIANLRSVLAGCGAQWERSVMARIYRAHFAADDAAMNAPCEAGFAPGRLPARPTVGVAALALGARVEIDLVVAL